MFILQFYLPGALRLTDTRDLVHSPYVFITPIKEHRSERNAEAREKHMVCMQEAEACLGSGVAAPWST